MYCLLKQIWVVRETSKSLRKLSFPLLRSSTSLQTPPLPPPNWGLASTGQFLFSMPLFCVFPCSNVILFTGCRGIPAQAPGLPFLSPLSLVFTPHLLFFFLSSACVASLSFLRWFHRGITSSAKWIQLYLMVGQSSMGQFWASSHRGHTCSLLTTNTYLHPMHLHSCLVLLVGEVVEVLQNF